MRETELRGHYAQTASGFLGTKEGSQGHRELLAVYNSIRPLPRGYALTERDPWCAAFASASAVLAGVGKLLPLECSCSKIIELARNMGIWVEDDRHIPKPGDWVLYNWDAAQTGDDTGKPDHVGVVTGLEKGEILVVEGNYDNAVKLRRVPLNGRAIRGFVCPDYRSMAEREPVRFRHIGQVPEYARATIEKLLADGSLKGISEEDLGLTEDLVRVLVILDRRGVL